MTLSGRSLLSSFLKLLLHPSLLLHQLLDFLVIFLWDCRLVDFTRACIFDRIEKLLYSSHICKGRPQQILQLWILFIGAPIFVHIYSNIFFRGTHKRLYSRWFSRRAYCNSTFIWWPELIFFLFVDWPKLRNHVAIKVGRRLIYGLFLFHAWTIVRKQLFGQRITSGKIKVARV